MMYFCYLPIISFIYLTQEHIILGSGNNICFTYVCLSGTLWEISFEQQTVDDGHVISFYICRYSSFAISPSNWKRIPVDKGGERGIE